ncbi:hypothetical protein PINS_up015251 [Pythium insidiosum]|nr:hypothetical protein PINS_up015251 [Pythium insidiosum]
MTDYVDDSGRSDVDDDYEDDDDEEDELRRAARAGILLLEKNQELQNENAALRAQVEVLESERPSLHRELQRREDEVTALREERKKNILEVNALRGELRAKSTMVTDLLDREQRLKQTVDEAADAKRLVEYQLHRLQLELEDAIARKKRGPESPPSSSGGDRGLLVFNPAASYDSNQTSVFTLTDYEELMAKWQESLTENETLQLELKSARKDLDSLRRKAIKASELQQHVERLEKKTMKMQHVNDTLQEELAEERALIESLRTMNGVYKKIAESRPFSTNCTCAVHPDLDSDDLGVSMQDLLVETNERLEKELRDLRIRLESERGVGDGDGEDDEDGDGDEENAERREDGDEEDDNNRSSDLHDGLEESHEPAARKPRHRRRSSEVSSSFATDTPTASSVDIAVADAMHEKLLKRIQELQEKLVIGKEMLKHTKQQWLAAIASQKALEECNRTAQDEIARLTQLLDYQMASLSANERDGSAGSAAKRLESDYDDKWVEETAPFPAPPGDLNSPLIKCLLDHWTTDKSRIMHLTDWLHHAIRGTGKPTPLRLEGLSSEVAAGFTQLLVPILRERHGVSVTIYRRDNVQVLTDMVLQAHQPGGSSFFSAFTSSLLGGKSSPTTDPASSLSSMERPPLERSNSGGSASASSEGGSIGSKSSSVRRRRDAPPAMSEAHFLYG